MMQPGIRSVLQATVVVMSGFAAGLLLASVLAAGPDAGPRGARGGAGTSPAGGERHAPLDSLMGSTASPLVAAGARASFGRLVASLPGTVQMALAPLHGGRGVVFGGDGPSADLGSMRTLVVVALLRDRGARGLRNPETVRARAAIAYARHAAVLGLFAALSRDRGGASAASRYLQSVLRTGGDTTTAVSTTATIQGVATTLGDTAWTPSASLKLLRALGRRCLLSRPSTNYVLHLMREGVPSQRWGLGVPGSLLPAAYVSGWGPQPDGSYLVRQSGIIGSGSSAVAVAVVAHPPGDGASAFAIGRSMLTTAARWLRRELRTPVSAQADCGNQ